MSSTEVPRVSREIRTSPGLNVISLFIIISNRLTHGSEELIIPLANKDPDAKQYTEFSPLA